MKISEQYFKCNAKTKFFLSTLKMFDDKLIAIRRAHQKKQTQHIMRRL
jgi:hypothetical protein